MRAVVQRVSKAAVVSDGQVVGRIDAGLLVYLGVQNDDTDTDVGYIVDKIRHLRIFPDEQRLMNLDVAQAGGSVLIISAFTVAADARRGRRPAFDQAAGAKRAEPLYDHVCASLAETGVHVERGRFGAEMRVESHNAGPVCILLDSNRAI